ncbi:MAG: HAD-IIIA family hydrolase [Rhodospirillaceae bacterium]|nr:HAD-IIIA family hydrolase [Rhodospirillaceae bacterium]
MPRQNSTAPGAATSLPSFEPKTEAAPPRQAVILAGGRGTRLAPLTDTLPKPMIAFHGRPFLEYLVVMLRDQGIERIVMLLGYLPQTIMAHFGDGSRFGLRIDYSVTPVDDDTGRRIKQAQHLLDPEFLLLYCDNYWPLRLEAQWQHWRAAGTAAQVTVYDNTDSHTRDNLRVENSLVTVYDKTRTADALQGVDIGFLLLRRDVIDLIPDGNVSFEASLYPLLVAQRQLSAFVSGHRYYSVGSIARLPDTERMLTRQPAVILDRDGVLNVKMPRAKYVRSWDDWVWIDGAREAVAQFTAAGYRIIIVTNQAGVARGAMTETDLAEIHRHMTADIVAAGGRIDAVYHCPHGWDENCTCRKPKPGMLFQAQRDFDLDLSRVYFIGDDERDEQAANAAGCRFVMLTATRTLPEASQMILTEQAFQNG